MSRVKLPRTVPLLVLSGLCLICLGCGGLLPGNLPLLAPSNGSTGAVSVSIFPKKAALGAGNSLQFTATSYGPPTADLEWLVNGVPRGNSASGTISPAGLYTAPPQVTSNAVIAVSVISKTDPTEASTATVTVLSGPAPITVSVAPGVANLYPSQAQQFTATMKGTTNQGISWLVNGNKGGTSSLGTISSSGTYTAPLSAPAVPSVTITAMSTYDTASSATAAVTIMAAPAGPTSGTDTPPAAYYVDASAGNDRNDGRSPSTAWLSIAKVNGSTFAAGAQVLFKRGDVWREQLTIPSSGSASNPIVFGAYDSGAAPLITGFDVLTSFSPNSGVYQKTGVTTQPRVVAYNGTLLKYHHAGTAILANEWDWTSSVLYINVGDPSSGIVEAGQRAEAVLINNNSYVVLDSLSLQGANFAALLLATSTANTTIQNSDVSRTFWGIATENDTGNNNTVQNNSIHDTVEYGINWGQGGNSATGSVIQRNNIYAIGGKGGGSTNRQGIYAATGGGLVIQYNSIHDGGEDCTDHGIYMSSLSLSGNHAAVAYNLVYNYSGFGIKVSNGATYVDVYANILYNNLGGGIIVDHGTPTHINVYNNTIVGAPAGTGSEGLVCHTGSYLTFKNNIVYGIMYSQWGYKSAFSEYIEPGGGCTNIVFDYNLIWSPTPNASGYYAYDGSNNVTFGTWQREGYDTHSVNANPNFTNVTENNFTLGSNSPAIDGGENLGSIYQLGLDPGTSFPWGTLNQNNFGTGWAIGAFVYPNTPRSGTIGGEATIR